MRESVRSGLRALVALGLVAVAGTSIPTPARAQNPNPAAGKAAAPAPGLVPAPAPVPPSNPGQVLATVNGEPITKADFIDLINRYQIPPGNNQQVYQDAIDTLVNTRLLNQYLARQQLPVSEEKVDAEIEDLKKNLKEDGQDLATALLASGKTIKDLRKELASRQRWYEFLQKKGTDAALTDFVNKNQDLFSGKQLRASHIMLKLEPNASPADEERVRQRLLQIKRDVESNKMTFAEAANKYTEDPTHTEGDGGDIGYFGKNTGIIEEFADAAFQLKKGQISDPIRTIHGLHLIQVTDVKEGQKFDLAAKKQFVLQMYAMDLQRAILTEERKKAKIDVKPMPADLLPPAPAAAPASAPAPAETKTAAPKP